MKRYGTIFLLLFLSVLLFTGCPEIPEDIQGPIIPIEINIPVTVRTYDLLEGVEGESKIQWSDDSADPKYGELIYVDQKTIETIYVEDNLNVSGFSTSSSQTLGSVKINDPEPTEAAIMVEDWTTDVTSGSNQIFPENLGDVVIDFEPIDQFESATFDDGTLSINVENRLPVDLEIRGMEIRSKDDQTIFVSTTQQYDLEPLADTTITFNLTGKRAFGDMEYAGVIYSPGSGGQMVQVPSDAGTIVNVGFSELAIRRAIAILPAQDPVTKDSVAVVDDSTYIETAKINSGSFELVYSNFMNVDMIGELTINNLKKPDGTSYTKTISAQAQQNGSVPAEDLSGWEISTLTPGVATNELEFSVVITTLESTTPVMLHKNDSINVMINFADLTFESFEGRIKPTDFDIEPTTINFDVGDLTETFEFNQLNLDQPNIILNLASSSDVELLLNGKLTGANTTQQESMSLDNILIANSGVTRVELLDYGLDDLISSFSGGFPETFTLEGASVINPNYLDGEVTNSDSVYGSYDIEIPLSLGIVGGTVVDTIDVETGDVDDEDIEALNYGKVTIELVNEVAVGIRFTGKVLDEFGNVTLTVPPRPLLPHNEQAILVDPPEVDAAGNVISATTTVQEIELFGDEIKKFLGQPKLAIEIELMTPPAGSDTPVKFKTTDKIYFKVYATASYNLEL